MMRNSVWRRVKARDSAASLWVAGTERTAPRTISATLAITGSANPTVALTQSGSGTRRPNTVTWNGTRNITKNSSTSQGTLRKNCVRPQATRRRIGPSLTRASPSPIPAPVPRSIATSEIATLKAKPVSSSGAQRRITWSGDSTASAPCAKAGITRTRPATHAPRSQACTGPGANRVRVRETRNGSSTGRSPGVRGGAFTGCGPGSAGPAPSGA